MIVFAVPDLPSSIATGLKEISVHLVANLSEEEFDRVKATLKFESKEAHASLRQEMVIGSQKFEVWGLIGIHDNREKQADAEPLNADPTWTGFDLHFSVLLRRRANPRNDDPAAWESFVEALKPIWTPLQARIGAIFDVPAPEATLALKLPVALAGSEVPGFSRVTGMRLAQMDTEDPNAELYSAILQHHGTSVSVQASNLMDLHLDDQILSRALERALPVAKLAIPSLDRT